MRYPWANSLLFLFLGVELLTGFFGLVSGSSDRAIFLQLHRVAGYGLLAILVWKTVNVVASLRYRRVRTAGAATARAGWMTLTALLLATLALGIAWSWVGPFSWWLFSGLSWHIYIGVALVPLLLWHWFYMRRPSRKGLSKGFSAERRQFLRFAGAGVAGLAAWQASEGLVRAASLSGSSRRFTGSYEAGSFSGNDFPRVSWLNDAPDRIDPQAWTLKVSGSAANPLTLGPSDLPADRRLMATLDCTGGWHSTQEWSGVRLSDILDRAGPDASTRSVAVRSVTGYYRRFSLDDARGFLLATHVGGQLLSHGHGAPVRLVAPGRRGFEWVKWVTEIELSEAPGWWQPPLPLQ